MDIYSITCACCLPAIRQAPFSKYVQYVQLLLCPLVFPISDLFAKFEGIFHVHITHNNSLG